jgi:hypothetical protein
MLYEPWKYTPLPSASGLCHAINRFFDTADVAVTLGEGVARRWMAVYYLARLELPLEVRSDKIPPSHAEVEACGDGGEEAQCGWAHGGAECLVIVDAWYLRAALNAEASFEGAIALAFVGPHEFHELAAVGDLSARNGGPRAVGFVVGDLADFGVVPAFGILPNGLRA